MYFILSVSFMFSRHFKMRLLSLGILALFQSPPAITEALVDLPGRFLHKQHAGADKTINYSHIQIFLYINIFQLVLVFLHVVYSWRKYELYSPANFNFNFLCHFCIDFEILCAHQQEEILKILKHPKKSTLC